MTSVDYVARRPFLKLFEHAILETHQLTTLLNSSNHRTDFTGRATGNSQETEQFFGRHAFKSLSDIIRN
jgi:hypothetical protein